MVKLKANSIVQYNLFVISKNKIYITHKDILFNTMLTKLWFQCIGFPLTSE